MVIEHRACMSRAAIRPLPAPIQEAVWRISRVEGKIKIWLGQAAASGLVLAINGSKGLCGEVVGGLPPDAGAEDLDTAAVEHEVVAHGWLVAVGR